MHFFGQFGAMSSQAERDLVAVCRHIDKSRGSHIVMQGQTVPDLFVIERGVVRSYYSSADREVTVWFGYEGQNFASVASLFDNRPSRENIQCLENCRFVSISGSALADLYARHNDLNTIGRRIVELYCKALDERAFSLQTQSAAERYEALVRDEPQLVRRVPLGYIASFLGVSQETLSRVRGRQ